MATSSTRKVHYRESDGQPMGETTVHRDSTMELILDLQDWFADDPMAYVSGDEFLYWVEGQPRFNVSPDVWCVRGIDKSVVRKVYKTWLEDGKGPEFVVEFTSPSTRREDRGKKFRIYQNDLKVREYFLFDPLGEYLTPPIQGYRLVEGEYQPIEPVAGRLPSEVVGLHLEADGNWIRLHDPATGNRLLTRLERLKEQRGVILQQEAMIQRQDALLAMKDTEFRESKAEIEALRREIEALRSGSKPKRK